ncbi:flagellar hook-length control protein FliK [Chromohalobacter salexigens]|uniref:flagellar hook-length control protein FliK n=1 Tax=Chromohalobacter TaxID=42054 RepID=UPI0015B7F2AD|nr:MULTISPECIES: flagellar hook-length control protein FliK [Chromohalobacter]MCK2044007.1 flagellar hook-length control protein FliK [Chromohalobacter moromii]MCT8515868.1 flagellar hook-length control protein FliK [Chromohalobacter sp. TMW 2.2271]NWO10245.1 flagellar hook-length control protein FliK [Chromohalobacter salexigens]
MDIALLNNLQGGNQASATNLGNASETRGGKNADNSASPFASLLGKARGGSDAKSDAGTDLLSQDTASQDDSGLVTALNEMMQDSDDAKLLSDWLESGDASQLEALTQRLGEIQQTLGGDDSKLTDDALAALLAAQLPTNAMTTGTGQAQGGAGMLASQSGDLSLNDIQQRMLLIQQSSSGMRDGAGDTLSRQDLMARLTNAATNTSTGQDTQSLAQLMQNAQSASGQASSQGNGQISPTAAFSATLVQQAQAVADAQRGDTLTGQQGLERQGSDSSLFTNLGHNAATGNATTGAAANASAAASAAGASATATLTPQVGMAEWGQSLGQQVVRMAQRGDQQVELRLHPAELGPLSVSLKMGDQQQANLQFFSAHGAVRHALEAAIPQLREALADSGIALGETSVGEQDQFQQQSGEQQGEPGSRGDAQGGLFAAGDANADMPSLNETPLQYIASSGISLYA